MNITKEVFNELEGLYVNQIVCSKYELTESEKANVRAKNQMFAENLDRLKVSWTLQNQVAYEGTNPKNWELYNKDVIKKVINQKNH